MFRGVVAAAVVAIVAIRIYSGYLHLAHRLQHVLKPATELSCTRVQQSMPGPEDMAYTSKYQTLFVSSHDRRHMWTEVGFIFRARVANDPHEFSLLAATPHYPADFRPHGMSVYDRQDITGCQLYVISHAESHRNVIEVFNYRVDDNGSEIFRHMRTISSNEYLASPNDLFAVGLDSLFISNDPRRWSIKTAELLDDVVKQRHATLVHYSTTSTGADKWETMNSTASFGNGVIVVQHGGKNIVYRASAADYTLLKYELVGHSQLKYLSEAKLPISPDNLEYDSKTHSLIITGHVSTYLFMAHAISTMNIAPSSVLRYDVATDAVTPLFLDPTGSTISATSEGIIVRGIGKGSKKDVLYISQVFNPYILACDV
jgi:hypothetical protein